MNWSVEFQNFLQDFLGFLPKLLTAIITFLFFWVISRIASKNIKKILAKRIKNEETLKLLARLSTWTIMVFGVVLALDQVDFNVTGFVAGLGIVGFTAGFALQDIAKNFIAGLLLLIRQPFGIGDAVEISGYAGTVTDIAIRDTSIRTWDGELVILPNAQVLENPIKNFTGLDKRRRSILIGLGYEEDIPRARKIFLKAIQAVDGVEADPVPSIIALELGDSALMMTAYFWIDQSKQDLFQVHSAVVQAIVESSARHAINLPYPIQTVRLEKGA